MAVDNRISGPDQLYSVLMAVYVKERPEYFRLAIQSMLDQTVAPRDFVIVCDGPLTRELDDVIAEFADTYPEMFRVIRMDQNRGLGNALNAGLESCRYDLVARMDSDDISLPYRCECQLEMFRKDPQLALCSGDIAEFASDPDDIEGIRHVPKTHGEILKYARRRNPVNHMAVMYRRSAVKDAGGYIEVKLAEDYYLWVRMLQKGYRAANADRVLVKARAGDGLYARRGGLGYVRSVCRLQGLFLETRFITYPEYVRNCVERVLGGLLPSWIRKWLYRKYLRRKADL